LQDRKFCRYAVGALFNYYHWLDNQPPLLASGSCARKAGLGVEQR